MEKNNHARARRVWRLDDEREVIVKSDRPGGYKSESSSDAGTPVTDETSRTLRGGTPVLHHFWSAWYETFSFFDSGIKPPPASIARLAAAARSDTSMHPILQPLGVNSQQPARVISLGTMQRMVADPKKEAAERFSEKLNEELDRAGAPAYGRPAWLKRELQMRAKFKTTVTSCQKWLGGLQIPRSSHLSIIVKTFKLNHQLLMTGQWEPPPGFTDTEFLEVYETWRLADPEGRKHVLDAARYVAKASEPQKQKPAQRARHSA